MDFPAYETRIGQEIHEALHGARDYGPDVMQLLYVANRYEKKGRIEQLLAAGAVIICDRYLASSIAYGEAQSVDGAWLREIQRFLPPPDLTILLDIAPETAAGTEDRRIATSSSAISRSCRACARATSARPRPAAGCASTAAKESSPPTSSQLSARLNYEGLCPSTPLTRPRSPLRRLPPGAWLVGTALGGFGRELLSGARAAVSARTSAAPASSSGRAQAFNVAPVVLTSSTRTIVQSLHGARPAATRTRRARSRGGAPPAAPPAAGSAAFAPAPRPPGARDAVRARAPG